MTGGGARVVIEVTGLGVGLTDEQASQVEDAVMDLVAGEFGLDYSSERRPADAPTGPH